MRVTFAIAAVFLCCVGINAKNCKEELGTLGKQKQRPGEFRPKCKDNGDYEEIQCHGSTGYCYCVFAETGEIIFGTEIRFKKPKSCELTECVEKRHNVLSARPRLMGAFIPSCEEDGSYSQVQCQEGFCYCAHSESGEKIEGFRLPIRGEKPNCSEDKPVPLPVIIPEPVPEPKNCKGVLKELEGKLHMPGLFKPKCKENGDYEEVQCHGSTGYCFCVIAETGEKLIDSELRFKKPENCDLTECRQTRQEELKKKIRGAYVPTCKSDGSYNKTQCHGSSGYCFCVNSETGEKLIGSELRFKKPESCEMTECRLSRHEALKRQRMLLGAFIPSCESNGSYSKVQCKAGFCYCVHQESGEEIMGTRLGVRGKKPDCSENFIAPPIIAADV